MGLDRAVEAADDWEKGFALNDAVRTQWADLFSVTLAQAHSKMLKSLRAGQLDRASAAADTLSRLPHASAETLTDAARVYCAGARTAPADAERLLSRAVQLLRQAFAAGYARDAVQAQTGVADPLAEVKQDADFAPSAPAGGLSKADSRFGRQPPVAAAARRGYGWTRAYAMCAPLRFDVDRID